MMHPDTIIHSYWFRPPTPITHLPEPAIIIVDDDTIRSDARSDALACVFLQCEPRIIQDHISYVCQNASRFHTIMTYDHDLLSHCPNARFYIAAQTWMSLEYYQQVNVSFKEYKISTLAGSKCINQSAGHLFRQAIHYRQHELSHVPITFFRSSVQRPHLPDLGNNPFLVSNTSTNSKESLFHTFQFAIIIENTTQRNYFSEKLIDCLITKTIPIYYGGVNIHQFFNTTGWIILPTTSIDDLSSRLSTLHPDYYSSYQEIIEENYQKAVAYSDFYRNLNQSISREEYMDRYGS